MVVNEVKIFDIDDIEDKDLECYGINIDTLKLHNKTILNKKECIKIDGKMIQPIPEHIKIHKKYEYTKYEISTLQMFKSSEKAAENMLDSCRRKRERYEKMLLENALEELGIDNKEVVYSLRDCDLSIIGKCIFHNKQCLFCNRKEDL